MGPCRYPRFGLAVAPYEWLRTRDDEAECSPGSTTRRFCCAPAPPAEQDVEDGAATGKASPPGDPGCTVRGLTVHTYRFDDGSVIEVID